MNTFTFMHLVDAFLQDDLQKINKSNTITLYK